jgi:hypothetical protein
MIRTSYLRLFAVMSYAVAIAFLAMGLPLTTIFPDNVEIRRQFRDVMSSPVAQVQTPNSRTALDPVSGEYVRFDTVEQDNAVYHLFLNESEGAYPIAAGGNWIVKRAIEDGRFLQAKVFLQESDGMFLRIFPNGLLTKLDVYIEGVRIHSQVPIRMRFEDLLYGPFEQIISLTRYRVDWPELLPQTQRPEDISAEKLGRAIRSYLPQLSDSDDGAMDSDGRYKLIEDLTENLASGLNCSGFAKWVVDGMVFPKAQTYLSIEKMKTKHPDLRGNAWSEVMEDARDPYFGLDWTRNIAVAGAELLGGVVHDAESADVRTVRGYVYTEDIGYRISDLPVVMYYLAQDNPGQIYLGSVNKLFGSEPVLRQHIHVVVLIPYFDKRGMFRLDVMERNVETSIDSLRERYIDDHIHLVEIFTDGAFFPPEL